MYRHESAINSLQNLKVTTNKKNLCIAGLCVYAFVCICLCASLVYVTSIQVEGEQPLRSLLTQIIIREMMDGSALSGSLNSIPSCLGFPAQTLIVNVVVAQIVEIL